MFVFQQRQSGKYDAYYYLRVDAEQYVENARIELKTKDPDFSYVKGLLEDAKKNYSKILNDFPDEKITQETYGPRVAEINRKLNELGQKFKEKADYQLKLAINEARNVSTGSALFAFFQPAIANYEMASQILADPKLKQEISSKVSNAYDEYAKILAARKELGEDSAVSYTQLLNSVEMAIKQNPGKTNELNLFFSDFCCKMAKNQVTNLCNMDLKKMSSNDLMIYSNTLNGAASYYEVAKERSPSLTDDINLAIGRAYASYGRVLLNARANITNINWDPINNAYKNAVIACGNIDKTAGKALESKYKNAYKYGPDYQPSKPYVYVEELKQELATAYRDIGVNLIINQYIDKNPNKRSKTKTDQDYTRDVILSYFVQAVNWANEDGVNSKRSIQNNFVDALGNVSRGLEANNEFALANFYSSLKESINSITNLTQKGWESSLYAASYGESRN